MKFKITDLRTNEVVNEFELEGCTSTGDAVRSIYGHVVPDWVSCEAVEGEVVVERREREPTQAELDATLAQELKDKGIINQGDGSNEQGTKGADGSDTGKPAETIGGDDDASGKEGGQGKSRNGKSKPS